MDSLKVLIIEDNSDDCDLIVMELSKSYKVVWQRIENAASLIVSLDDPWDIVVCDYSLPQFKAEEALDMVRARASSVELPFIILSGFIDDDTAIEMLKNGANDFLPKDRLRRLSIAIEREMRIVNQNEAEQLRTNVKIQVSYEATIEAWGKALELRDYHSQGHTRRVTDCALRLAHHLGVPHEDFLTLNRGALLHDIGKLAIPDAVLFKQDVLSIEEWNIMKMHPILAYNMLKEIPFLEKAIDIPYCHHEKWDGTGYPRGLYQDKIPFLARLFSVCDVYDALTSDRPYRKSWDEERALSHILSEGGKSFDPDIAESFVSYTKRK